MDKIHEDMTVDDLIYAIDGKRKVIVLTEEELRATFDDETLAGAARDMAVMCDEWHEPFYARCWCKVARYILNPLLEPVVKKNKGGRPKKRKDGFA